MSKREYCIRDAVAEGLLRRGCTRLADDPGHGTQWVFLHSDKISRFYLSRLGTLRQGADYTNSRALTNSLGYVKLRNEGATALLAKRQREMA